MVGANPAAEVLDRASVTLKELFPIPLRIYNRLMYAIVKSGLDLSKPENANTIWDIQLAMSTPTSSKMVRTPVWIVTGDDAFHKAAKAAGISHVVHRLDSYLKLTRDGDALLATIDQFFNPIDLSLESVSPDFFSPRWDLSSPPAFHYLL